MPRQGWKDIVVRIKNQLAVHNLSIIAAGVAFYAFLSIFPALAALVSIYSLLTDPSDLQKQVGIIQGLLPGEAPDSLTKS
jgi:membrane protein